jgi:hypothetical protein
MAGYDSLSSVKHTVTICITVLLLALGGGYLAQQELILRNNIAKNNIAKNNIAKNNIAKNNIAKNNIAKSTFAKDSAYYDLEQSKFKFDQVRYAVELKEYFDAKAKSENENPDVHASPTPAGTPASDPNLRAEANTNP